MKKSILLSIFIAFTSISAINAQHFVSSCGVIQSFQMPHEVYNSVNYHYHGYDVIHSSMVRGRQASYFQIVLQRGNTFVQLNVDSRGRINQRMVQNYNPIAQHICNNGCGYNANYYVYHQKEWHHEKNQTYGYANKNSEYHSNKKGNSNDNQYERIDVNPSARYKSRDSNVDRTNTRIVADNNNSSNNKYPTRRN
ncbi:MAG: hypothetical protein ACJA08_002553 [Cyclobacteriaceae bacterium]|jgi:hypothetical protein